MPIEKIIDIPSSEVQNAVDDAVLLGYTILRKIEQPNGLWTIEAQPPAPKGKPAKPATAHAAASTTGASVFKGFTEPGKAATTDGATNSDRLMLARTIYGEARGQPKIGMEAVANVVVNRVKSGRYPNSVGQVCLQPFQFSCWNKNDPNRAKIEGLKEHANPIFDECLDIAADAVTGTLPDHTAGATHYYANYIAEPAWVAKSPHAKLTAVIGVHRFYSGIA